MKNKLLFLILICLNSVQCTSTLFDKGVYLNNSDSPDEDISINKSSSVYEFIPASPSVEIQHIRGFKDKFFMIQSFDDGINLTNDIVIDTIFDLPHHTNTAYNIYY